MDFNEYYKDKGVVETYEQKRSKGLKARVYRKLERKFVELLLSGCKPNILEAGVGTGFITEILRKHGKVSGFDISPAMIAKTKSRFNDMEITQASILDLHLKKKYDTIVSIRVLSHFSFDDAEKALKNLKTALNPSGVIIFNLENKSLIRRIARRIMNWGSTKNFQYSEADIDHLMKKTGLRIEKKLFLDHLFLLPLHVLNKLLFNSLESSLVSLETKLSGIKFTSSNTFLKCKK